MGNVGLLPVCIQNFAPTSTDPASPYASTQKLPSYLDVYISIVSNSHLLHEALILLLQNYWSMDSSDRNASSSFTSTITPSPKHLVLLDSGIGHNTVVSQIQKWRSLQLSPCIVVLQLKNDSNLIFDYIEAGAQGYVLESASSTEVIKVIEQVYRGGVHCSPEITSQLFDRLTQSKANRTSVEKSALTQRELEVLCCIAKEYSNHDIATELIIEVRTVKHHVHNILRKLNVKYRRDAAQLAIDSGWLNLTSN